METGAPQVKDITIADIQRNGKMHGIVRCRGVNFGIIADDMVDPYIFTHAAAHFHDAYMELIERASQKGDMNV